MNNHVSVYDTESNACEMNSNARNMNVFHKVDRKRVIYFDIWPVNLLEFGSKSPDSSSSTEPFIHELDRTGLFLLQLACLVARSPYWRKRRHPPKLRVFFPLPSSLGAAAELTLYVVWQSCLTTMLEIFVFML